MAIIGIDLGTTNSLGAVYRNGRVELIPNCYGSFLTPSVVSVEEDGRVVVGEIAKSRLISAPNNTVGSFKKDMGSDKMFQLGSKCFSAEELSSFIIASIVEDAKAYLNEDIEEVIISVPAYFHDQQRVATKRAGALANVKVNRIINEPSAAALSSYYNTKEQQMFLIFDFGGGTLDVSIVDCFETMVEIISVAGDNCLGGDTFHDLMVDSFLKEHDIARHLLSDVEYAVLLKQAEICKKQLTVDNTAIMSAFVNGQAYKSEYSNERLMNESGLILTKIKKVLSHAINDSGLSLSDISAIVMVGGSSKMPLIQKYLKHLFKQAPIIYDNCDELIARGLGVVCGIKARNVQVKDYILTDICPFSLGIEVLNHNDFDNGLMDTIIDRNSVLPCSRVQRFYTSHDNQDRIRIKILQGEHHYAKDNLFLEEMVIKVPKAKAGKECVDIRFTYDLNGILIVDVLVVSTQKTLTRVISSYLDEDELLLKVKQLEQLKVHPKDMSENKMVYERLLALYEEVPPCDKEMLRSIIGHFEYLLQKQDERSIYKYRQYVLNIINQLENYDPFISNWSFDEFDDEGDDEGWIN